MLRQIYINDAPLQMFTEKTGNNFLQLVNELLLFNIEFTESFNELIYLNTELINDFEVYIKGDEDSKTITLQPLNIF